MGDYRPRCDKHHSNQLTEPSSKFLCYPYFEEDGIGNMAF